MTRKTMVFTRWAGAVAVVAAASGVAMAQTPRTDPEQIKARQKISMVEGMLERAVQNGADNLRRQIEAIAPGADGLMLMGAPQVRGFRLAPFGVFFDVEVPSLQLSMVWPLRYTQGSDSAMQAELADLRVKLERNVTDPDARAQLQQTVSRLEAQVAVAAPARGRTVSAATPRQVTSVQAAPEPVQPPASPADMGVLDDPNQAYQREVRSALVDAMIENTGGVSIGPEEYIIVAARRHVGSDRLVVGDATDARTIELRLKGSDLAAFRANTITLDEARKRVEVREY